MKAAGLVFELAQPTSYGGTDQHCEIVIPERMSAEPGPLLDLSGGRWLRATSRTRFLGDDVLPRFIGTHMARCDRNMARTRSGFVLLPRGGSSVGGGGVRAGLRVVQEDGGASLIVEIVSPSHGTDRPEERWAFWGELEGLLSEHLLLPRRWALEVPPRERVLRELNVVLRAIDQKSGEDAEALVLRQTQTEGIDKWFAAGQQVKRRICRIETPPGNPIGTGFLVGRSAIMTNAHVQAELYQRQTERTGEAFSWSKVVARFDFYESARPVHSDPLLGSTEVPLQEPDRVSDLSIDRLHPLDCVILRLSKTIAESAPSQEDPQRGFLRHAKRPPEIGEAIVVVQHPAGRVMEIGLNTVETVDARDLTYKVNTEKGSSGSPCLSMDWKVIGLHKSGGESSNVGTRADIIAKALGQVPNMRDIIGWDLS